MTELSGRWETGGLVSFSATSPAGFDVLLDLTSPQPQASFGGLWQSFDSVDQTLRWVARAFSEDCTLRIDLLNRRPIMWTLEGRLPDGSIVELLKSGIPVLFRIFRKNTTEYRSNARTVAEGPGLLGECRSA